MKKNLFSLSILAIALTTSSCINDLNEGQKPGANNNSRAITFEAWTNKQTRAASTAADITDFRLLAVDTFATPTDVLINGLLVTGGGSTWTYSPLAYWPERDTVNFYGFSPASSNGVTNALAGQTDPPSIDYELPGHSANASTTLADQEDLLVVNHTADYAHEGAGGVKLNFRHALSRILVQAKSEGLNDFVVLGVALKNIKSSGTLNLGALPKDAAAFAYPTDNATVALPGYQTFWDTSAGTDGDLAAVLPAGGVTVSGDTVYTDIIGDDDALYVIPQENAASVILTKTNELTGGPGTGPSGEFYIEITYKDINQTDAEAKTYAVPVPAIAGDARASSIAFEMERQYTFQFELFGRKPLVISKVTVSDYKKDNQEEPLRLTWAGSNIYWDGTKLTFADSGDKTKEQYQGVLFKWGGLIGISPNGTAWSPQRAYVPDVTAPDGSWSINDNLAWANIPYISTSPGSFDPADPYLTDQTNATNITDRKGDICVYLTQIGAAPKGKRWRMPTGDEFKISVAGEYQRIPETGGWTAINTVNHAGTTSIPYGYTKISSNRPYFPASGWRNYGGGGLAVAGTQGIYWSSSPSDALYGYGLDFGGTAAINHTRPVAAPVRCVVE